MTVEQVRDILLSSDNPALFAGNNGLDSLLGLLGIDTVTNFLNEDASLALAPFQIGMENYHDLSVPGNNSDLVPGIASAFSQSDANAVSLIQLPSSQQADAFSDANATATAFAIGIENTAKILTGKGNDLVLGVAKASGNAVANAGANAELNFKGVFAGDVASGAFATAGVDVTAVGVSNSGKIYTGRDEDIVLGIAHASGYASATAKSEAQSSLAQDTTAISNGQAASNVTALAIGIDNINEIRTGRDKDIVLGWAGTDTVSLADAFSLANNAASSGEQGDYSAAMNVLETAVSRSLAEPKANSITTTLGIVNTGKIRTEIGSDIILGVANSSSTNAALGNAEAVALANDNANANSKSLASAIIQGSAVGIVNPGTIDTGIGNDMVIGIGIIDPNANAKADADAVAVAPDGEGITDSLTTTDSLADVFGAISIGIDNTDGEIKTVRGDDQIVGYGTVGILGGDISSGSGNDSILGYGNVVGIENSRIKLGNGNDYLRAAAAIIDPLTGEVNLTENQSGAIVNSNIRGGHGNDIFEIGGFSGEVTINGGQDHDILRLGGSLDDYEVHLGSSHEQSVTLYDEESTLTIKHVEELQFANDSQVYSYADFA